MSIIFVTHDVGVATEIADELAVMYAGKIVEIGDVADVIKNQLTAIHKGFYPRP